MGDDENEVFTGRYELLRELAAGGTATIYEAKHIVSQRTVALKILPPRAAIDAAARERFNREASAPAQIGHPAVVEVFDAGIDPETGSPYVAMELLEGQTLRQRLREGGLSLAELLEILLQVLEPLSVAHEKGFVHRDLKPENIFLEYFKGPRPRVRLLDFGLTRHRTSKRITDLNATLGTPNYMSPEQIRDPTGCGPSTDVWAVGIILYEALAGRRPYHSPARNAVIVQIVQEDHVPLRERRPKLSDAIVDLVERCLTKDPSGRPANAGELLLEMQRLERTLPRGLSGTDMPLPELRRSAEYTMVDAASGEREVPMILPDEQPTAAGVPKKDTAPPPKPRTTLLDTIRESFLPTRQGKRDED